MVTIGPDASIRDAVQMLVDNNIGALPVCDEKMILTGIVSERDLLKLCLSAPESLNNKVKDIMTRNVAICSSGDDLDYAANVMKKQKIRHLPVVSGSKIVSIISMRDIIETQLHESEAKVKYAGLVRKSRTRI